jgi:hypothetical protein
VVETGGGVIEKSALTGLASLTPWEALVYCLWVADYGMTNAGDLDTASDVYADFQSDARRLAEQLSLPRTLSAFSLTKSELERQYFSLLEDVVDEIRRAEHRTGPGPRSGRDVVR